MFRVRVPSRWAITETCWRSRVVRSYCTPMPGSGVDCMRETGTGDPSGAAAGDVVGSYHLFREGPTAERSIEGKDITKRVTFPTSV
ncbi:hypothetical protein GCM10009759_07120 [Kitasatospora saccharophila]|uniref:Uncharacterized protein n=1 Tax=Kitasatospora saccharophila TaxID=407973 RepID=A0ABP5HVP8_9ACTN